MNTHSSTGLRTESLRFLPSLLRLEHEPPSPLPRVAVGVALLFFVALAVWAATARLDVIAVAPGRIVPGAFLQIVQPAEGGVVRALLVAEGEAVREGQVLARMERRVSDAEFDVLQARTAEKKRLEVRRLDAELAGGSLVREAGDPPLLFAQAKAQLEARRHSHADALAAERMAVSRARHEDASATAQQARLRDTVPLLQEQADAWAQLVAEGFAGRLQAQERRRAYLEGARELDASTATAAAARAAADQAQHRLAQLGSARRQQLLDERAAAQAEAERLQGELRKHAVRHELLELRAPRAGIVKELVTHTAGAVVQHGTVLMSLVRRRAPARYRRAHDRKSPHRIGIALRRRRESIRRGLRRRSPRWASS